MQIIKKIFKLIFGQKLFIFLKDIYRNESFVNLKELRSWSDNGSYVQSVEEAINDYKKFKRFKSDKRYQFVLEHATFEQGLQNIEIIKKNNIELLDNNNFSKFKLNDLIGSPKIYNYGSVYGNISPTTIAYIKVLSDLMSLFKINEINTIAEIGAGYGGQALIIDQFTKKIEFTLFDLKPVLKLTEKYLESFNLNGSFNTKTLNEESYTNKYDLIISNYAFSELPKKTQILYLEKVLIKSKRGYLIMNSGSPYKKNKDDSQLNYDEIVKYLPSCEVLTETPLTSENNYLLVWGNNKN